MSQDRIDPSDRPFVPPPAKSGRGLLNALTTVIALVVLAVSAYLAYQWLVSDVARRRAAAEHGMDAQQPPASAPAPTGDAGRAAAMPTGPAAAVSAAEPAAPAVIGGGINRCVADGQETYTTEPCPAGSAAAPADVAASGVAGATDAPDTLAPMLAAEPEIGAAGDQASQQQADCNFLSAEINRLNYEFRQPLPPPVLDDISTQLAARRAQAQAAQCLPPPPKPAASAAAPARKRGGQRAGSR